MTTALSRDQQSSGLVTGANDSSAPPLTAVVVDECALEGFETLLAAIGPVSGAAIIVVTRHPVPPSVIGIGSTVEAVVMWNECHTEWRSIVAATAKRVDRIVDALRSRGLDEIDRADSFPTRNPFRRAERRETEGVIRLMRRLQPDRIVIDPAHHLASGLVRCAADLIDGRRPSDADDSHW